MDNTKQTDAYGMQDYTDIKPMNDAEAGQRRKRSIAIASVLGFLIVLFYITTITRLAENLKKLSAEQAAAKISKSVDKK